MFTDVNVRLGEYYVVFEYDGIKYKPLTCEIGREYELNHRSKICVEQNREPFKLATKRISGNEELAESKTNAEWIIKYDLNDNDEEKPNQALYKGVYDEEGNQQFLKGQTYYYLKEISDWRDTWNKDGTINTNHYAFDINCGLNKKYFDLSLGTDVMEATVVINGNQTTYSYDQILNDKLDEALNKSSASEIEYNLYLAHSDYNYRIRDYKVPNDPNEKPITNKYDETTLEDFKEIKENKKDTELEIYVTYKLQLRNQSANPKYKATVNLVEYHYDEKYEFVEAYYIRAFDKKGSTLKKEKITEQKDGVLMIDTSNSIIEAGENKTIGLTFKVKPDKDGNKCTMYTDYLNQAEIVSYTTEEGGLVDADSAPGNAFLTDDIRYEDDTDEANGIQIKFKENAERSISGCVFEDSNKNSTMKVYNARKDPNEEYVNDVIVQLIELVDIGNKQYEYIWQETVAGSNTVKTTARNGYEGKKYEYKQSDESNPPGTTQTVKINDEDVRCIYVEKINSQGEYKFVDIIPGNYIVRFIYGDGTYFDTNIDGSNASNETKNNIKKYNGEDYKSTYVYVGDRSYGYHYNREWYNTLGYTYNDDGSIFSSTSNTLTLPHSRAVDNEARRLKVMSYAVDVNKEKGALLALLDKELGTNDTELKDVLDNTWMCAETLKIKVPVDPETDKKRA